MKISTLLVISIVFSTTSFSQNEFDKLYTSTICNCFDSLKQKKVVSESSFPLCFQLAVEKNPAPFIKECLRLYGDTTEETGNKFGKEFAEKMSVSLVATCKTYFLITDSLRYEDYKYLNKDSLKKEVQKLEKTQLTNRDMAFYDNRGLLYFQLGLYDNALKDISIVLKQDPKNVKNIFTKAWIHEINQNYSEAILLYQKAVDISHIQGFEIFTAIAIRKKNGL
jgi:tetratricopeptide (TPR) repeat protein